MTPPVPSVSIIIPAYNRAASIRVAIESVLRQTWSDFELIVVDDGSSDATLAAAAEVADPRIRVVAHGANRGASAARNTGIREARGTWVAFQDSDDEWLPLKLEKQMARLLAPGTGYVAAYCGMLVVRRPDGAGGRPHISYIPNPTLADIDGDITTTLMKMSVVSTQTLVARRDSLLAIGGFDEAMPALIDWECMLRLAPLGPVACVDEPLVLQSFSANSITLDPRRRAHARARVLDKHHPLLARNPDLLARLYALLASEMHRLGDHAGAARALAEARGLRPADRRLQARLWAMSAYVGLRRLGGRRPA